jgi:hypothetical protein
VAVDERDGLEVDLHGDSSGVLMAITSARSIS